MMHNGFFIFIISLLVLMLLPCAVISESAGKKGIPEFGLGVYWPWERTQGIADNAGLDKWTFVRKTCKMLAENGSNVIWLVNISAEDTHKLAKIAGPMGIRLLPCLGEIAPQNCRGTMGLDPAQADFHEKALAYYRECIPRIVKSMGEEVKYIAAWIICDEPTGVYFDLMEPVRKIFNEADPGKTATGVTMWPQTPNLIAKTNIDTFCVDLYPFFEKGNTNGPHTPEASRNYYTYNAQRMVEEAGKDGRIGWIMPQCFGDIWGPSKMQENGVMIALPGAFVNWRTPTLEEIRWQIWEALRVGVKGIVFYTYLGEAKGNPDAKPPQDPAIANLTTKKAKTVGISGLVDQKGRSTPEFKEMSALFLTLKPHLQLLRRLEPVQTTWLASQGGVMLSNFIDPDTETMYAIAVNPNFKKSAEAKLTAAVVVQGGEDLLTGKKLPFKALGWAGGNSEAKIKLPAGGGMIIKLEGTK